MKSVTEYLDHSAAVYPDKIAIVDQYRSITFKDLRKEALHIASYIIRHFQLCHRPVCFYLDKSASCISAMMGIAYSGNFYTPIDTKMPKARIEKILETLEYPMVLTDKAHLEKVRSFAGVKDVFCLEDAFQESCEESAVYEKVYKIIDTDVLYVLFTSGSTGTPKGVIISHRSVIDYIEWVAKTFHFNANIVFGNQAPFYFDNSVLDIYSTLKNSATMYIIPQINFAFPIKLMEFLQKNGINTIFWVPSALCLVSNLKAIHKKHVDTLHTILFAGEVMPNKQLNQWRYEYPNAVFGNLYGPTEITVDCTFYIVDRKFENDESLPIGKACPNSDVFLLNEEDQLVTKPGVPGEICVRGTSLAYGYYNNPEKTAEVFVQNPLQNAYRELIYKTGDLAKYNNYGELVYISRKDFQVKHMGRRIELGEIETIANSFDYVDNCCCVYDDRNHKIVIFYSGKMCIEDIKESLRKYLPDYMMPNEIKHLRSMPLNINGKVDRPQLKKRLEEQ